MQRILRRVCLPLLLSLLLGASARAAVLRVKADAPGPAHDGGSWSAAFTTVTAALAAAAPDDELWVAAGVYNERITLKDRVSLYGGFAGGEAVRDGRNLAANETVLDAGGQGRVVFAPPGMGEATTLDGFTLRNGTALTNPESGYGGGILCYQARPNIRHNRIVGNTAERGGAVAVKFAGLIHIESNRIEGNTGGIPAVYLLSTDAVVRGNVIARNRAIGRLTYTAGAVYAENGTVTVAGNVITENDTVETGAGGIELDGADVGGVISGNVITANSGGTGGIVAANARIENNTVAANTGPGKGAVVFAGPGNTAANNIVAFNAAGVAADAYNPPNVTFAHNCLYGNAAFDVHNVPDPVGANGNISVDPGLVNVTAGNLHIQPGSPCRAAGANVFALADQDVDGQPRVQGGTVDIGADESDGTEWSAAPLVMHVRPEGSDAADGRTWQTAKQTPQAAVDALSGSGGEVWVAAGTYGPPSAGDAVVTVPSFVSVYGGFAGTETERGQRDWRAHRTVVDGGGTHMGFHLTGGYRVSTVDGFTVTNTDNRGGWIAAAIMSAPLAGPLISHNTLTGNRMGRLFPAGSQVIAALAVGGPALVTDNVVSGNLSDAAGVASYGGSPEFRNNTVVGNSGGLGAAVSLMSQLPGKPTFVNNLFAFNTSGVVELLPLETPPVFRNNCFFQNGPVPFLRVEDPIGDDGNVTADPRLADFGMGDNHLTAGSPCIDAGEDFPGADTAHDIDGEARRLGPRVDIGADEYGGLVPVQARRIVRVRPGGSDDADGGTWDSAVKTIQRGVDLASEQGGEVWVAAGTYPERVTLRPYVYLYGGFDGTEAARADRDPQAHRAVIKPAGVGTVVSVVDAGVYAALDGFTISGGDGSKAGGVYCSGSSPVLAGNHITGNRSMMGGGIGLYHSFAVIRDNIVDVNTATSNGGGIYAAGGSRPLVERNRIGRNTAGGGGGLGAADAAVILRNNLFVANVALVGSGMKADGLREAPTVVNNTFVGNKTTAGQPARASVYFFGVGTMVNNIVAFNDAGVETRGDVRNNDVYGNPAFDYPTYAGPNPTGRNGNISADPLFVNRAAGDYHLAAGSPARDAGADTVVLPGALDLDGAARIQGYHVDMGAYEAAFIPPPFPSAVKALRVSAGLDSLTPDEKTTLNVATDGPSANAVDLQDAITLLRGAVSE